MESPVQDPTAPITNPANPVIASVSPISSPSAIPASYSSGNQTSSVLSSAPLASVQPTVTQDKNSEIKPKTSSNPTIMVAVAILVLFAGGIGFFYYSYKNTSPQIATQTSPYSVYTPSNDNKRMNHPTPSPVVDSDTQNIDNTTASLDTDMNSVNSSLNDQQTDLSQ